MNIEWLMMTITRFVYKNTTKEDVKIIGQQCQSKWMQDKSKKLATYEVI